MMRKESHADTAPMATLPWKGDDQALLARVREGGETAAALLYERFSSDVSRMIWRLLGADSEHEDLANEVFVKILVNIRKVREASSLRAWVLSITVNTVRSELRKRAVRRRLQFWSEPPEPRGSDDHEGRDLVARTFAVLERLPVDERLAFSLRYIDGHSLVEVAELCGCSLATAKRRIGRAEERFGKIAQRDPRLGERLAQSTRWGKP